MSSHYASIAYALATLVCLAPAASALAEEAAKEAALSYDAHNPALKWGGCPEIFPAEQCQVTALHGDPAKENTDVFLKVAPNTKLQHHWHTSAERMILIAGELKVTYDGQPPVLMQPGMYAYGPPKLPHTAECLDGDSCILFIAFEKPVDAVATEGAAKPAGTASEAKSTDAPKP
jgi:quercetin dioxygenase-like cupin family protein